MITIDKDNRILSSEYTKVFEDVALYGLDSEFSDYELCYTTYETDLDTDGKSYSILVRLTQITPEQMNVGYGVSTDLPVIDLFSWNSREDNTPYDSDGDIEISAEFAYKICFEIEETVSRS